MIERVPKYVEEIDIIFIDEEVVIQLEQWLRACERCAGNAPFAADYLLDALTGCEPAITEYLMLRPARCPCCSCEITEKTRVAV
jgi:hypothetical protein